MITGALREAYLVPVAGGFVISGAIYGDSKGRFNDGERVRTSLVLSHANGIVQTRNSTYSVEPLVSAAIEAWNAR